VNKYILLLAIGWSSLCLAKATTTWSYQNKIAYYYQQVMADKKVDSLSNQELLNHFNHIINAATYYVHHISNQYTSTCKKNTCPQTVLEDQFNQDLQQTILTPKSLFSFTKNSFFKNIHTITKQKIRVGEQTIKFGTITKNLLKQYDITKKLLLQRNQKIDTYDLDYLIITPELLCTEKIDMLSYPVVVLQCLCNHGTISHRVKNDMTYQNMAITFDKEALEKKVSQIEELQKMLEDYQQEKHVSSYFHHNMQEQTLLIEQTRTTIIKEHNLCFNMIQNGVLTISQKNNTHHYCVPIITFLQRSLLFCTINNTPSLYNEICQFCAQFEITHANGQTTSLYAIVKTTLKNYKNVLTKQEKKDSETLCPINWILQEFYRTSTSAHCRALNISILAGKITMGLLKNAKYPMALKPGDESVTDRSEATRAR
jgi:hypothetical protein